jgi:hypothetical protein
VYDGSLCILRGHAPLMALLGTGTLRIDGGGFVPVSQAPPVLRPGAEGVL